MRNIRKSWDVLLNVLLPIVIGVFIYFLKQIVPFSVFVSSHLADGLWAYAFISCILIIWDRKVNVIWVAATFCIAVSFELLQYNHIIAGTGDLYDVVTYFIFFIIALISNIFFKSQTKTHS